MHKRSEEPPVSEQLLAKTRNICRPLEDPQTIRTLIDRCAEKKVTLLGEASHGTSEFYTARSEITKQLIERGRCSFIAVEGDWPDCYQINRFVKALPGSSGVAEDVLQRFSRWPTWMWANAEIADLMLWLRDYNLDSPTEERVGFYGLDVYSLWESMHALHTLLQTADKTALVTLREVMRCFDPYYRDAHRYAKATFLHGQSCEEAIERLLKILRSRTITQPNDGRDTLLQIEQNAEVLKNAELYYRSMAKSDSSSWNIRDEHMAETLDRLLHFYGEHSQGVVWEHNTHIGDASFTDMNAAGMINIGQLARKIYGEHQVALVGFSTYRGRVVAGDTWGAPARVMMVPPAREGSWDATLHSATKGRNALLLFDEARDEPELTQPRGQRAIGVVYQPQYEHLGNYVPTLLPGRYDALLHLDETQALRPLHANITKSAEAPDTFPSTF